MLPWASTPWNPATITTVPASRVAAHVRIVDLEDAGLGVRIVGQHAHLSARVAAGIDADLVERNCQEADGHLLAGGGDHVELAARRIGRDLLGETEQAIGLAGHGGHHDDELVALLVKVGDATRDVPDAVGGADGRAAVLLDDQRHVSPAGPSPRD
jgi:hypothetical protein